MTIIVVGDVNADLSAAIERFPAEGGDSAVASLGWSSGGSAANTAAALAQLGQPTRLLARVGADPAAAVALRAARAAGADMGAVQIDAANATGLCYIAVSPDGNRTFFSFRGANTALDPPAHSLLDNARWLHVSAYALIEGRQRATVDALIAAAHARQVPISIDLCTLALHIRHEELRELLPRLAIMFANQDELALLCPDLPLEQAAAQLVRQGLPLAAIKLGAQGCLLATPTSACGHMPLADLSAGRLSMTNGQRPTETSNELLNNGISLQHLPAYPVAVVDTSGCGDAFVAGFLAAYLRDGTLEQCGALGNALGALTATRYGAAEALPSRPELREFLARQPGTGGIVAL